ncbi:hypothetical protein ACQYWY_20240 [Comamonas sediminis]|uniref:hypothetical protein n=1 Tax=Comamonas sediminis TaxID=1783360 RepID=UPI003D2BBCD2
MASSIEDLDELTLRCRDDKARVYIQEAVASYRAGAFRSSIVACWIAVCFDVIEKIRELSIAGDKEAEKYVLDIDSTRRDGDVTRALRFERELLLIAKDKFELISPLEFIDLERLQEDRNRCAHPSLTADDIAYSPSAELARLHIHSAVIHLLQHPPAQGKYALDLLLREVESEYFPTQESDARLALASGLLKRPRKSLVRNFIIILAKALLNDKPDYKRRMRLVAASMATAQLHHGIFSATLSEKLSVFCRSVPDDSLEYIIYFLRDISDSWQYIQQDVALRLNNYVKDLPPDDFLNLDFLLGYTPLKASAQHRVSLSSLKEIHDAIFFIMPTEVVDRLIHLFLKSKTFDDANSTAKELITNSTDLSTDQIRYILSKIKTNYQILESYQLGKLIIKLRNAPSSPPADEFEKLLSENNLSDYSLNDDVF